MIELYKERTSSSIMIPSITFTRDFKSSKQPKEFKSFAPSTSETLQLLSLAHRMASYVGEERAAHRLPLFDMKVPSMASPIRRADQGLPLGGIGCGSIGRSHTGDFNRIDLQPLACKSGIIRTNQFSIRTAIQHQQKKKPAAIVLSTLDPTTSTNNGDLSNWNFGQLNPEKCTYHALFPCAWYKYEEPLPNIRLICKQISPCTPNEYDDSGLPVTIFRWFVENTSKSDTIDVSLMFTYESSGQKQVHNENNENTKKDTNKDTNKETTPTSTCTEYQTKKCHGVTLLGYDLVPDTALRPKWLDSPKRIRYCTFREFALFLLFFFISLIGGPIYILYGLNDADAVEETSSIEIWYLWIGVTLFFLLLSQIAFYHPCMLHVVWCNRNCPRKKCCYRCQTKPLTYHRPKTAYTISADVTTEQEEEIETTVSTYFPITGDSNTSNRDNGLWQNFLETGRATTSQRNANDTGASGAAVAQSISLQPGETKELRFCLSWASPVVHFGAGKTVTRRYARLLLTMQQSAILANEVLLSQKITSIGYEKWKIWEDKIEAWQNPVLKDESLPTWYKSQLFNELYFLQAGGAIWCDDQEKNQHGKTSIVTSFGQPTALDNVGHWLYLEGQEYYMYNTADVHFYASAALGKRCKMERQTDIL